MPREGGPNLWRSSRESLSWEQVANPHAKRLGQPQKVERGAVTDAPFDPALVAATDSGDVGESLLRQPLLQAQLANASAEPLEGEVLGRLVGLPGHGPDARSLRPFGPRPIGYNARDTSRKESRVMRQAPRRLALIVGFVVIPMTVRPCGAQEAVSAATVFSACEPAVQAEANGMPQETADRRCQEAIDRFIASLPRFPNFETIRQITAVTDSVRAALVADCLPRQRCQEIVDRRYEAAKAKAVALMSPSLVQLILEGTTSKEMAKGTIEEQLAYEYKKQAERAEEGNATAQFDLGVRYADGEGVPKDSVQAAAWFRKAAEQGHQGAQAKLSERSRARSVTEDSLTPKTVRWTPGTAHSREFLFEGYKVRVVRTETFSVLAYIESTDDPFRIRMHFRNASGRAFDVSPDIHSFGARAPAEISPLCEPQADREED